MCTYFRQQRIRKGESAVYRCLLCESDKIADARQETWREVGTAVPEPYSDRDLKSFVANQGYWENMKWEILRRYVLRLIFLLLYYR